MLARSLLNCFHFHIVEWTIKSLRSINFRRYSFGLLVFSASHITFNDVWRGLVATEAAMMTMTVMASPSSSSTNIFRSSTFRAQLLTLQQSPRRFQLLHTSHSLFSPLAHSYYFMDAISIHLFVVFSIIVVVIATSLGERRNRVTESDIFRFYTMYSLAINFDAHQRLPNVYEKTSGSE